MRILLSGIAGDIAESISEIIKQNSDQIEIVGSDTSPIKVNYNLIDKFIASPPANSEIYFEWLSQVLQDQEFNFFIPTSEPELEFLSKLNAADLISLESKVQIIWAGKEIIQQFMSKTRTSKFLQSLNLDTPKVYENYPENQEIDFPVIVKPDKGRGSRDIFLCHNKIQLDAALVFVNAPIIQEYVSDIDNEYTCGIFRDSKQNLFVIVFRRYLSGGLTNWVELVEDHEINRICELVADKINLNGSINIQLRKQGERIVIFEVNPRFSSTILFRSIFGFEDLLWSLGLKNPNKDYNGVKNSRVRAKLRKRIELTTND